MRKVKFGTEGKDGAKLYHVRFHPPIAGKAIEPHEEFPVVLASAVSALLEHCRNDRLVVYRPVEMERHEGYESFIRTMFGLYSKRTGVTVEYETST